MKKKILVSVVVVSYNAEKTIIETLDSIKEQTYKNIELIISDDCSKDETISICRKWLIENKKYFISSTLFTASVNQGVCKNFNKAIFAAQGEWIKIIAADDKLLPNCIDDYVHFVIKNNKATFVTSVQMNYKNTFTEENCLNSNCIEKNISVFEKSASEQLKIMAYRIFVNAPTMFFKKSLFELVGGFDEQYVYEDHPFYINILEAGHKIYFMNKPTVCYRIHDSISNSNKKLFNYEFSHCSKKFRINRCCKYYKLNQRISIKWYYGLLDFFEKHGMNRKTQFNESLFVFFKHIISFVGKF